MIFHATIRNNETVGWAPSEAYPTMTFSAHTFFTKILTANWYKLFINTFYENLKESLSPEPFDTTMAQYENTISIAIHKTV